MVFFGTRASASEYVFESVPYRELWERQIDVPDFAHSGKLEEPVAFFEATTIEGDVDLIVTDCESADIFQDNLAYSYTFGVEQLMVDLHQLSRLCVHALGNRRNKLSQFSLFIEFTSKQHALNLFERGTADSSNTDYTSTAGEQATGPKTALLDSIIETLGSMLSMLGKVIIFILQILA
mgnify:FL=1